ncbi:MAG: 50S ribosomal protein L4 [Nanoarchaeota archaeon]|nr:50S ribosomal protein L4 [Nanoarchaeota archaeon]
MKGNILDIEGKKIKQIELPKFFGEEVKLDLIRKILEIKKTKQPYGPSPVAGNQHSASGKLKHHRHVWKSQYGRGMSRVPRKQMSRRGSNFNWVGATVPNTRGGRRAHPPKVFSMFDEGKINKKELRIGIISALSATASGKWIEKRYFSIKEEPKNFPIITESKISTLKTKELLSSIKKILGENLFEIAIKKKEVRSGKSKMRGRRFKSNLGLLIVVGEGEKLKTTAFDVVSAKRLGIKDLADGNPGRLTIYTEKAIENLTKKYGENKK